MKLLLDECVVQDFRHAVSGHEVHTVGYVGWSGTRNGKLLTLAAASGYDALITTDKNIEFQQNPSLLPVAVIVLDVPSNDIDDLLAIVPALHAALATLVPRSLVVVKVPAP